MRTKTKLKTESFLESTMEVSIKISNRLIYYNKQEELDM